MTRLRPATAGLPSSSGLRRDLPTLNYGMASKTARQGNDESWHWPPANVLSAGMAMPRPATNAHGEELKSYKVKWLQREAGFPAPRIHFARSNARKVIRSLRSIPFDRRSDLAR